MSQLRLLAGLSLTAVLLGLGCAIPVSESSLTDEKTSTLDERLIGFWNFVPKEKDEQGPPAPQVIGRMKDQPNVLQITWIELDGDGHTKVTQTPLYTTKIGDLHYFSFPMKDKEDGKEPAKKPFLIARYEVSDEGVCKVFIMNGKVIAEAIDAGQLKGVVRRSKRKEGGNPNEVTPFEEIRITAEPKELAAFLKTSGKACYANDEPLTFQRVKTD